MVLIIILYTSFFRLWATLPILRRLVSNEDVGDGRLGDCRASLGRLSSDWFLAFLVTLYPTWGLAICRRPFRVGLVPIRDSVRKWVRVVDPVSTKPEPGPRIVEPGHLVPDVEPFSGNSEIDRRPNRVENKELSLSPQLGQGTS